MSCIKMHASSASLLARSASAACWVPSGCSASTPNVIGGGQAQGLLQATARSQRSQQSIPGLGLPILLVFAGLSMAVSNTSANSLLQATVAAPLRGRTISLFMLAMRGGISIGSLITGISVNLLGVRYALLINGLLALATHIMIGRRWTPKALPPPS